MFGWRCLLIIVVGVFVFVLWCFCFSNTSAVVNLSGICSFRMLEDEINRKRYKPLYRPFWYYIILIAIQIFTFIWKKKIILELLVQLFRFKVRVFPISIVEYLNPKLKFSMSFSLAFIFFFVKNYFDFSANISVFSSSWP